MHAGCGIFSGFLPSHASNRWEIKCRPPLPTPLPLPLKTPPIHTKCDEFPNSNNTWLSVWGAGFLPPHSTMTKNLQKQPTLPFPLLFSQDDKKDAAAAVAFFHKLFFSPHTAVSQMEDTDKRKEERLLPIFGGGLLRIRYICLILEKIFISPIFKARQFAVRTRRVKVPFLSFFLSLFLFFFFRRVI